jgi:hypothetical protein
MTHGLKLDDATDGLIEDSPEGGSGDSPNRNHESRSHERDEHPTRHISPVRCQSAKATTNGDTKTKKTVVHDDSLE